MGVRNRPALRQCLWRGRKLDEIQGLHTISPTIVDCPPRCPIFYGKRGSHTMRISPCDNSGLSSANDTPICEPTDEVHPATKPNKDWWDSNEAEQHKEDDEIDRETRENSLHLLRPTNKRYRPSARERSFRRRGTKRHRFSSPISSNLGTDTGEESDYSIYRPSKAHDVSRPRPASSYPINPNGNASEDRKMEDVGERSRMAVIYEQQSWITYLS